MRILLAAIFIALASIAGRAAEPWRAVHVLINGDWNIPPLIEQVPKLRALGVNTLIAQVDYRFAFDSDPKLRSEGAVSRKSAAALAAACRDNAIRLIPQFSCLGHQSWAAATFPLLTVYPELDETPGQFPANKGIYCRSWCPRNPEVLAKVLPAIDEIVDAFGADAVHIGMDEVFLIASDHCPRCRGADPAALFAQVVNDLHAHLVDQRKLTMLMWADRLIDAKATGNSEWEASANGTAPAADLIPRDIILCDWHYGRRESYPSIPLLLAKGFRVLPAGWDKPDATEALMRFAADQHDPRMLGHLCTTWSKPKLAELGVWPPIVAASKRW